LVLEREATFTFEVERETSFTFGEAVDADLGVK
jgi:hypothetical protein